MIIKLERKENTLLIKQIEKLVSDGFQDLFLAIIVQGSVATNEIIPYSDFDGLLLVKDNQYNTKKFKIFVQKSMKLIYEFDPLQHHGWFVIKESELKAYPQTYFPHELFEYTSLIYPEKIEFEITIPETIDYSTPFLDLCASLDRKIQGGFHPKNDYQLKAFLSEIMLLPTLFLQAKVKKGIHKKESFEMVKAYVQNDLLGVIEQASSIRANWKPVNVNFIQKFGLTNSNKHLKKIYQKYFFTKLTYNLNEAFNTDLQKLILQMRKQLN